MCLVDVGVEAMHRSRCCLWLAYASGATTPTLACVRAGPWHQALLYMPMLWFE
jgi:hypothetical protein